MKTAEDYALEYKNHRIKIINNQKEQRLSFIESRGLDINKKELEKDKIAHWYETSLHKIQNPKRRLNR